MLIVKHFEFEMAHCLDGHKRGCNNVHGHSYKLDVGYEPTKLIEEGSSEGMGVDFGDLKKTVNKVIVDKLDHSYIYNIANHNETKIAEMLESIGKKVNPFYGRTTCENMALRMLYDLVALNENFAFVRLYETSGSYVEVWKEDLERW